MSVLQHPWPPAQCNHGNKCLQWAGGVALVYAVRPMLMPGCSEGGACSLLGTEGPLHLAGYGVELAIKNMEYSALDDSQVFLSFCLSSRAHLRLLLAAPDFSFPTQLPPSSPCPTLSPVCEL